LQLSSSTKVLHQCNCNLTQTFQKWGTYTPTLPILPISNHWSVALSLLACVSIVLFTYAMVCNAVRLAACIIL
jgi:hypothetical protein